MSENDGPFTEGGVACRCDWLWMAWTRRPGITGEQERLKMCLEQEKELLCFSGEDEVDLSLVLCCLWLEDRRQDEPVTITEPTATLNN